jgi:hypothetical protein
MRNIRKPPKKAIKRLSKNTEKKAKSIGVNRSTERYRTDPEFRQKHLENQRAYYRKKKAKDFEIVNPMRSLSYFATMAEIMEVEYKGRVFKAPCFTKTKVAELLQVSLQTFWRQTSGDDAIIPSPVLLTRISKKELLVYHLEEVRAILTIIGDHKRRFAYYRKDHFDTKEKLYSTIRQLRQQWETTAQWLSGKQGDRPKFKRPVRVMRK